MAPWQVGIKTKPKDLSFRERKKKKGGKPGNEKNFSAKGETQKKRTWL